MFYLYTAVVVCMVLITTSFLVQLTVTGRKAAAINESLVREKKVRLNYTSPAVLEHKKAALRVLWSTLILIGIIEFGFLLQGRSDRDVFFYVHLGFAIFFLVTLVFIIKWYDGFQKYHFIIAYTTIASFGVVAPTGIVLQLRRLPEAVTLFTRLQEFF